MHRFRLFRHSPAARPRAIWAFLGAVALSGLAACGRGDDPNAQALDEVQRRLAAVHAGRANVAAPGVRAEAYQEIVSALRPVATGGTPEQQAAANRLLGGAWLGQASLAASDATALERRAAERIQRIQSRLDFVVRRRAEAGAIDSVDPSQERTGITEQMEEARRGLEAAQAEAQDLTEEVESLQTRVDAKEAEAAELRQRAGALRAQAIDATATRGAELVEQAYAIQREADAADAEAARIQAEIESLMPLIEELQEEIQGLRTQLDLLSQSRAHLQEREEDARARADAVRAQIDEALSDVDTAVDELESLRADRIAPLHQSAIDAVEDAISSLRRAQTAARGDVSAAISLGEANQRLGEIHAARARALSKAAALYARLDSLTSGRGYDQALAEETQRAGEARQDAVSAFGAARDAYSRARPRDQQLRDRLDRLTQSLDQTIRALGGGEATEAPPNPQPRSDGEDQAAPPPPAQDAAPRRQ